MSEASIDDRLLFALRRALGDTGAELAEPPVEVGRGVQARVWAVRLDAALSEHCGPLVVRVFEASDQDAQARYEGAVQNALVEQGFPTPSVLAVGSEADGLGHAFMVMERLPGRPLMDLISVVALGSVAAGLLGIGWVGYIGIALYLAVATRPLSRLHGLDGERFLASLQSAGVPRERALAAAWIPLMQERTELLGIDGMTPAFDWLRANLPTEGKLVVCHGDYHPGNLMVTARGLSGVIDWTSATVAAAEFDLAWSLIQPYLNAQLPQALPVRVRFALDEAMRPLIFLGTAPIRWIYRLLRPLNAKRLKVFAALAALRALVLLAEVRVDNPWHNPRTMRLLCRRFEHYTGECISLPDHVIEGLPRPEKET